MYMSTGVAAMKMPDSPPIMNMATNARAQSIGVVNCRLDFHVVPSQLNVFTALGRAIMTVASMNPVPSRGSMPLWNMWWPQTMNPSPAVPAIEAPQPGDAGDRVDHRPVAEQRLAGERRDDVADHAHRGQDHDVDGRVRVE